MKYYSTVRKPQNQNINFGLLEMKGQRTQDEHKVCVRKQYSEYTNFGRGNKTSLKTWLFVEKQ